MSDFDFRLVNDGAVCLLTVLSDEGEEFALEFLSDIEPDNGAYEIETSGAGSVIDLIRESGLSVSVL